MAQFSVYVRGDFDYVLSVGLSGAYPCEAAHCPATNRETSSYNSYRICGCETGHVRRVEKHAYTERGQKCTRAYI